jgi:hypothetical protein
MMLSVRELMVKSPIIHDVPRSSEHLGRWLVERDHEPALAAPAAAFSEVLKTHDTFADS